MSADTRSLLPQLDELLQRCRVRARVQVLIRGLAGVAICLCGCLWLACLVDYLIPLPGAIRLFVLVTTVALTTAVAWQTLLRPLMLRVPDEELGAAVDLAFPEFQEAIASVMYFRSAAASSSEAGSAVMRRRLLEQVRRQLPDVSSADVVDSRVAAQRSGIALATGLLIAVPLLVWTSGASLLLQRLVLPLANLGSAANLYFEVPRTDRIVAHGDPCRIVAFPRWRSGGQGSLPERVMTELAGANSARDSLLMKYDREQGAYTVELPQVTDGLRYRIAGGGVVTEWFRLQVAERPRIVSTVLHETPPSWSGRPERQVDGVTGLIDVFEHSQIEIRIRLIGAPEAVELRWRDREPHPPHSTEPPETQPAVVSPEGQTATIRFEAVEGGRFELIARNHLGLTNSAEPERRLNVIRDQPPVLVVTGLPEQSEMRPTDVVPLDCEVTDDMGIAGLELQFQKNDEEPQARPVQVPATGPKEFHHQFRLSLSELGLDTGDRLTIRVRADDRRGVPGPQSVWQGPWTIAINPTAAPPGTAALTQENQQMIDRLRTLERELHQEVADTDSIRNESSNQWNDQNRQRVREVSQSARDLGRRLPQLAEEVAEHPLMQRQARQTEPLSDALRQSIPQQLDRAAEAGHTEADGFLQMAGFQLRSAHDQLHSLIDEIEFLARLEHQLTELNRMSLAAEKLAAESDQLEQDEQTLSTGQDQGNSRGQKKVTDSPNETGSSADSGAADQQPGPDQDSLQERRQRLESTRKQLSSAVDSLLKQEPQLLASAQRAQLEKLDELAGSSQALADQQELVAEGIAAQPLDGDRSPDRDAPRETPAANNSRPRPPAAAGTPQTSAVQDFLQRISQMIEANRVVAASMQADSAASAAAGPAQRSVDQAVRGLQAARSGKFGAAANLIQAAAASSLQAADNLTNDANPDRISQLGAFSDEMSRLAESMRPLQYDGLTQRSVQQDTQQTMTENARELSARLSDVADRMSLPTLGMPQEGRQSSEAGAAASSAADSSEKAAASLQQNDLEMAARDATRSAELLHQTARLSQQVATREREQNPLVPSRVGDQIAEALLQLDRAGRRPGSQPDPTDTSEQAETDGEAGQDASGADDADDNRKDGRPAADESAAADESPAMDDQQGQPSAEDVDSAEDSTEDSVDDEQSGDQQSEDDARSSKDDGAESDSQPQPGQDDAGQDDAGQDRQSMKSGRAGSRRGRAGNDPAAGRSGTSRQLSEAARALAKAARAALPRQFTPGQSSGADGQPNGESQESRGDSEQGEGVNLSEGSGADRVGRFRAQLQDQLDQDMHDATAEYVDHEYAELIQSYRRQLARTPSVRAGDQPQSGRP